ncbi:MAG TPA: hypothetical protein VKE30_10715 [Chthoniobacterales bacterium]|nr:hypothetical protein [Chthoniobacterales bacterium]
MKKRYFFGYLFVAGAKLFAFVVMATGIGFCLLQYSQAKTAAAAAVYQPSVNLQQTLRKLQDALFATEEIVRSFNKDNQSETPRVGAPNFPATIDSDADLARVGEELSRIDQDRQRLKQSMVNRFETLVTSIEGKLRSYAESLEPSGSSTPTMIPSPVAATAGSGLTQPLDFLFSSTLTGDDFKKRNASLAQRKEFLKVLGGKAENAENRAILNEAANQLDQLSKLLPEKFETPATSRVDSSSLPAKEPPAEEGRKVLVSERIAGQLGQLRGEVRQSLLTSWILDDVFDQASELTSAEREKCRVATLAQKGIWLSAGSKMLPGLLATVLLSFMILVFADVVRTLLDTAAHTGTVADAINALRGSIATARGPHSESMQRESMLRVEEEEVEETPVEDGS